LDREEGRKESGEVEVKGGAKEEGKREQPKVSKASF